MICNISIQGGVWSIQPSGKYIKRRDIAELVVNEKGIVTGVHHGPENLKRWIGRSVHEYLNYLEIPEHSTSWY